MCIKNKNIFFKYNIKIKQNIFFLIKTKEIKAKSFGNKKNSNKFKKKQNKTK